MIRRILIVEDRKIERETLARVAEAFGHVEAVSTLAEAEAALQRHPAPGLILSDLHLHDGHTPIEVASTIYRSANLNLSRLVFMTTDTGDAELVRTIRQHFPSIRLVQKSQGVVTALLKELREDESGQLVDTMDNSKASRDTIRAIVREVIDELLVDLDITWFDAKTWVRAHLRCLSIRDRLAWSLGLLVAGGLLMAVASFIGAAILDAARDGLAQ